MVTPADVLLYLQILIGIMVVVVLYHVLFAVVDLRKILRRLEGITQQVEDVIMKPISMVDNILEWVMEYIEKDGKKSKKSSKKK